MFLDSNPVQLEVFEKAKDQYFTKLLDVGLNSVPLSEKPIAAMSEHEFKTWLKKQDLSKSNLKKYKLKQPVPKKNNQGQSKTITLPLSIENNATITGTAAVLEHFGKEFGMPCNHSKVVLPYDENLKTFNIEAARKHHEFLYLLQEHKNQMVQLEEQLARVEKQIPDVDRGILEEDGDREAEDESNNMANASTFQKIDGKFKKVFTKLTDKMWQANQSVDAAAAVEFKQYLRNNREQWENATDHHGCTVLHHAVQNGNVPLVQTLINAGINPNVKERCGATPLTLAVLKGDEQMVKILLENFAICNNEFFSSVPGPKQIADKLGLANISQLLKNSLAQEDEEDLKVWEATELATTDPPVADHFPGPDDEDKVYSRGSKSCKTLLVGDQGTNKITRSVKEKSLSAYGWAAEVPGDLHARGKTHANYQTTNLTHSR